jgi:DNA-binding MarR family transcriptional regulator
MSTDDSELWLLWRRTHESVRTAVLADVTEHVGISEPDLLVLIHLDKARGVLRQNALANALGWDRTRLSHLLTRIEGRGFVARTRLANGAEVSLTDAGQALLNESKPHVAEASRRQIGDRLGPEDAATLHRILQHLLTDGEGLGHSPAGSRRRTINKREELR